MLRQATIHIPKSDWSEIIKFLDSPVADLEALTAWVVDVEPMSDIEDLADACSEATGVSPDLVETVLVIAINISSLRRRSGLEFEEVLGKVADSLESNNFPQWDEGYSELWEERLGLLNRLLVEDGAIEIMSKARELLYEFQSVIWNSAVLTDIRHIYNSDATALTGGLILHTLSLEYTEDRRIQDLHLTLSTEEIERLVTQLQRALLKVDVARQALATLQVPDLTPRKVS